MKSTASIVLILALCAPSVGSSIAGEPLQAPLARPDLRLEERVVAGGPDDFATVRHVRLEGTQAQIGRALARIAAERHGWRARPSADPMRTSAQRRYFERNAPLFVERMRGVAAHAGLDVTDDTRSFASLGFGFVKPGCTVAYYPPSSTSWGTGVVSRNFDFTTGTFRGKRPGPDDVAVCSSPYVLEIHPERGYASLSICAYDLLGGVVDGINEEGLTIALLADDEATGRFPMRAAEGPQAGFGVVQIGRHLLETCATVDEAKAALLEAKLYYTSIPCHYLIADRYGRSFVWENSISLTQGYVFDGGGEPQVTTNFLYQLHPDRNDLPAEESPGGSFNRYRAVWERIRASAGPLDREAVCAANACVSATRPGTSKEWAPGRTLWHALYYPEERRMEVDFYLGEGADAIERSGYIAFALAAREEVAQDVESGDAGSAGR